ncbi:hypothetical protein GBF38_012354 [Nibea albiflora]|uniref:Uncharacterized protein n=1 Tax=Nibea albiflora TaxID=240163 RepID=A0ACB7EJM7_NIBAL|nr:hypothetical protein GBF38_012354 [Nibea albiflora]
MAPFLCPGAVWTGVRSSPLDNPRCISSFCECETELEAKYRRSVLDVAILQDHIVLCQEDLRREKREHERVEREKDATVNDLQHKLDNMEADYEKILHETLDSLTSQLSVARQGWEEKSTALHQNYKELLSEFGLNALDI